MCLDLGDWCNGSITASKAARLGFKSLVSCHAALVQRQNSTFVKYIYLFNSNMRLITFCNSVGIECHPDKMEVAGSNPARTTNKVHPVILLNREREKGLLQLII